MVRCPAEMKLADFISPDAVSAELAATNKTEALAELGRLLASV